MKQKFIWQRKLISCLQNVVMKKRLIRFKRHNGGSIIDVDIDEFVVELFRSLLHRYQVKLEQSMKCSNFLFDFSDEFFYDSHKTSLKTGR